MSGDIIVPPDLSVEEQAEFIRKEMLTRGIDPDSTFPLDIIDPAMQPVPVGGISMIISFAKDPA